MNTNKMLLCVGITVFIAGCSTTNSIPYKASTGNVIAMQQSLESKGKTVNIGEIQMASGVEESLTCRLMGPIKVAPGKTMSQYIKDAFVEELFLAKSYSAESPAVISAQINNIKFSSVTPANWEIEMDVSSPKSNGYKVSVDYKFDSSWDAYSACKNVADAFGPAVQQLINKVVTHPDFGKLAG